MMRLIRGYQAIQRQHQGAVITIGNFDGVHLGHRAVLQHLLETAQRLQAPSLIILFEPQPQEYFTGGHAPPRLTRLREKLLALQSWPIDYILLLTFNAELANLSAEAFIQTLLVERLKIRYLTIGADFRFGQHRRGHLGLLEAAGLQYGFEVVATPDFIYNGERVSSTRIRQALHQHQLALAQQLLGRPYQLCGRVRYGYQRGRQLGFPTANIALQRLVSPVHGVYVVQVVGLAQLYYGIANLGIRPTLQQMHPEWLLEVHIFNFSGSLYGQYLQIELLHWIRNERIFKSFAELQQQIQLDVCHAQQWLTSAVLPLNRNQTEML